MIAKLDPALRPRQGHTLMVLAVCRISTLNQDERSLSDQEALYRRWLKDHADMPFEIEVVAGQGSGENLQREDYLHTLELVESRQFDLVISEDLGRICRRVHAHIFAETCEDAGTRLIAINDHLDTFRDDWRLSSFFAVMRHEAFNRDTAARIRRSQRNRFTHGGVFQFAIYGYIKPNGAVSDTDVRKDPAAEPIYRDWFRQLEQGASFAEIADWLNAHGIAPGPYSRGVRWDGTMVGRVTRNPILKGVRLRNQKMSKRVNKTGRRICVKAPPEERLERACPHLAFFDAEYYDHVIRLIERRNAHCRRNGNDGRDSRLGLSRKRTRWPGQHLRCGICHRLYYWGGSAAQKYLKCSGSHQYKCWSAIDINGELVIRKLAEAILAEIMALPDFDRVLLGQLREHWDAARTESAARRAELGRQMKAIENRVANVAEAIASMGAQPSLQDKLRQLEDDRQSIQDELAQLERTTADAAPALPSLQSIITPAHKKLKVARPALRIEPRDVGNN